MEGRRRGVDGERERRRHSGRDRGKEVAAAAARPMRKVQVFYYLSRNGRLEQPHFLEVSVFSNQPLRLRDVMDRLTVLRGKAIPSLYSWSCKRNYKSGYVWNDLSENDVVYPAEGAEYVLKGSELLDACSVKLQEIEIRKSKKREGVEGEEEKHGSKSGKQKLGRSPVREMDDPQLQVWDLEYEEVEEYGYEEGEKASRSESPPHLSRSRGVSTEELQQPHPDPDPDPAHNSKRFTYPHELELPTHSAPTRNSVLLQFIACGGSALSKGKTAGPSSRQPDSKGNGVGEDREMIKYMSENPRFGKLQAEEKEFFSGSIVDSIREHRCAAQPVLNKSASYNQEKSKRGGLGDGDEEKREVEDNGRKAGRCLPRMISAASAKQSKKL